MHKLNRIKSKQPRGHKGWCACDRTLVSPCEKCPACGRKYGRLRDKKSSPTVEDFV